METHRFHFAVSGEGFENNCPDSVAKVGADDTLDGMFRVCLYTSYSWLISN